MIQELNLVKQIQNKELRKAIIRAYFGVIPANGKTYSVKAISENLDYYRKLAEGIDKKDTKK